MLVLPAGMGKSPGVMRASLVVLIAMLSGQLGNAAEATSQQQINTAVEALTRLENVDLESRPAIKAALNRLLERTSGTPQFVRLVQHFKLTNQTSGLLEVAINNPKDESGVAATRLALAAADSSMLQKALSTTNVADAVRLTEALGNAKEKKVVPLLEELVVEDARNIEVRRAAVIALAQT
jgi:hypothetical protein